MSTSSDFFGSYHDRLPAVIREGVKIDPKIFSPSFSLPIRPFVEPLAAREMRLAAWADLVRQEQQSNPDWHPGEMNGLPASFTQAPRSVNDPTVLITPKRYANLLWTQDNPTTPTCFYDTDWTYFNIASNSEYFEHFRKAGILPPLMAGIHLESPRIPLKQRPADKMGRPGEKHPPSCAMRMPNHFYCASEFLLKQHLGALGYESADKALQNCEIIVRQIHAYNPDKAPERPHLTDYCLVFEGGIPKLEP